MPHLSVPSLISDVRFIICAASLLALVVQECTAISIRFALFLLLKLSLARASVQVQYKFRRSALRYLKSRKTVCRVWFDVVCLEQRILAHVCHVCFLEALIFHTIQRFVRTSNGI